MSFRTFYLRAGKYVRQHGLSSSLERVWRAVKNLVLYNRDLLFCRDLIRGEFGDLDMPENFRIERFEERSEATRGLLKRLAEEYPEELLQENFEERFEKGAWLWCLRHYTEYVGYVWTLKGKTLKPWYFPLMKHDVYLFDALIFAQFRRRGLHSVLLNHVLRYYKSEGFDLAYLETREWNLAVVNLMSKHEFVRIGLAKRRLRRGKCKVKWWG